MTDDKLAKQLDELKSLCLKAREVQLTTNDEVVGAVDWVLIAALVSALAPLIFKNRPELAAIMTQIVDILRGLFA